MLLDIGVMVGVYIIVRLIALALRPWHDKDSAAVSVLILMLSMLAVLIVGFFLFDLFMHVVPDTTSKQFDF